jgi:hypothetical protein
MHGQRFAQRTQCMKDHGARALAAAFVLLAAMALAAAPGRATTYKWVDEKGTVHYTDKIPPEAVNKGSTVLDKQARPLKKIDPALTPEQLRARETEEEQKRANAKQQEETARRDRALISSYTTEAEIDLARTRSLTTIDSQLESARAYASQLTRRREDLDKRKAALGDKPLPPALERELEGTDSELAKQAKLIGQKERERAAVLARYESDKARWRELKAITDANAAAAANAAKVHPAASGAANGGTTSTARK